MVTKNFFDSNIPWNENVSILRRFRKDYFEASTEAHVYMRRHQGVKCEYFDISSMIYHKFSHGAASSLLNGENINFMFELSSVSHLIWSSGDINQVLLCDIKDRGHGKLFAC